MSRASRCVALWRAINLGSHHRLPMADLRQTLSDLGLIGVQTVLQTGNVVFESGDAPRRLEQQLEEQSAARWRITTPVMVRTAKEWAAIVADNPFAAACAATPSRAVLMCLKQAAVPGAASALARVIKGPEQVHLAGRHLYLVYPDGIGASRLTPVAIERAIGTAATARNWNTVLKIDALLRG